MTFIKTGGRGKTIPPPPTITASNGLAIAPANNVAIVGGNTVVAGWLIDFGGSAGGSRIIDASGIGNIMSITATGNAGSSLALAGGSVAGSQGIIRLETQVDALAVMRANNAAFKARIGDVARVEGGTTTLYELSPTQIVENGPSGFQRTVNATLNRTVVGTGQAWEVTTGVPVGTGIRIDGGALQRIRFTSAGGSGEVDMFTNAAATSNSRIQLIELSGVRVQSANQSIRLFTSVDNIATAPSRLALNQNNLELSTSGTRNILVQSGNDLNLIVPNDVLRSVTIGASVVSSSPVVNLNGRLRIPGVDLLPRVFSNRYWEIRDQSGIAAYIPLFT